MSADAQKTQRQRELEEKRKKLEAIRAAAKEQSTAASVSRPAAAPSPAPAPATPDLKKVDNVEDLLRGLDAIPAPLVTAAVPLPKLLPESLAAEVLKPAAPAATPAPEPQKLLVPLTTVKVPSHDIPPRPVTRYTKGTQTVEVVADTASTPSNAATTVQEVKSEAQPVQPMPPPEPKPADLAGRPLSENEKKQLVQNSAFQQSLSKAATVIERAVNVANRFDIFVDYAEDESDKTDRSAGASGRLIEAGKLFDERWCKHRSVTDIAISPKHPDLIAVSYSASDSGSFDSDGLVLVWSMQNLLQRPEYVLTCQSPVMTVTFSRFHPTIVIGGTYSGQLVVWDMRAKSSPVARSPLSAVGHTHPLYSLAIVGTQNANNLVSISTDGRLCVWSIEALQQPVEAMELYNKQTKVSTSTAPIAVTCLAFPDGETNEFYVGSEEGAVFQAFRHGSKTGVFERFDGHYGPITSLSFHPVREGSAELSDLFLTTSVDWSVKLWSRKVPGKALYSFDEATDYVYDAQWSPTNPSVFASADGRGNVDIWNLGANTEQPVLRHSVCTRAVNRLSWTLDGRRLLVGDATGTVSLWDAPFLATARPAEVASFEERLREFVTSATTTTTTTASATAPASTAESAIANVGAVVEAK